MANSGLKHADVGDELSKAEWLSEEGHELVHGTSFPGSPVERQLFYRDDEHKWYIYTGSSWTELTAAGGGASTFLGLTDTPSAYTGQAGKYAKVNSGEDALEFDTPGGGGDMLKSVYDTGDDGVVDDSEKLEGSTKAQVRDHSPQAHKASHQDGGSDEISVAGLSGLLADGQTPLAHKTSHEDGGSDEISIEGLAGEPAALTAHEADPDAHHSNVATLTFVIDGGGSAITTGQKGHLHIPFNCIITQVTLLADQTGSIVIDIWKDGYGFFPPTDGDSITASAPPTISSAQKSQDITLSGWTTYLYANDVLAFNVDSCTAITRVTLCLKVEKA